MSELVVRGRRLVTPQGVRSGQIHVRDGRLAAIEDGTVPAAAGVPVLDAGDAYVLPGLVDAHVHFRTPGLEYKEDWEHASRAAVAGGVTTVLDMPNTVPPTLGPAELTVKSELITGRSLVDFGLHIGADPAAPEALAEVPPGTAASVKVFLTGHHTAPTVVRDRAVLERVYAAASAARLPITVHAEDDAVFALLDRWLGEPARYQDYERHRPRTGGLVAVARLIELADRYDVPTHVLHLSSAEEADLVCAAAHSGVPITFEITGHHLSFTSDDTRRTGARTRLSPSIRGQADQDRLWETVFTGQVRTIGSDHAPHTVGEKSRSVADCPPGLPGVQELATAVWTGMRRRCPAESPDTAALRLAQLLSTGPAELFGLPGKGRLEPGADADMVLFDPDHPHLFGASQVQSRCGWSAYEGWTMAGRVTRTIRDGRTVWDSETGVFGEPDGRLLSPNRAAHLACAPEAVAS